MPYSLTRQADRQFHLLLWPHNTLPPRGFAWVIGGAGALLAVPLLAAVGSPVLWGLLPFAGLALWALWYALQRNWRDRQIIEDMHLRRDSVHLCRTDKTGIRQWQADPHWISLNLTPSGGPVPQYLTMTGGGREVELGAFLTPEERLALHEELSRLLIALRSYQ